MSGILIDLELAEWVLAGVAALGVVAAAWLEFRREHELLAQAKATVAELRDTVIELDLRTRMLDYRLSHLEEKLGSIDDKP